MPTNKRPAAFGVALVAIFSMSSAVLVAQQTQVTHSASGTELCLDGFCIGQSINDARFDAVEWLTPNNSFTKESCEGIACAPAVAFRGYAESDQQALAEAVSWVYELGQYNILAKNNLQVLRRYKYECNRSARGSFGERRFLGLYRSVPSRYLTVVGLRLIDAKLKVYRIARQYPYRTPAEFISLAKKLREQYGETLFLCDYLSSNAHSDVIKYGKNGWFAYSHTNSSDPSDNAAELVLIDPRTRSFLQPALIPASGEIEPFNLKLPEQCSQSIPLQ